MYEVQLHLQSIDSKFQISEVGNLQLFYLKDSDSVCELLKMLPNNILISLREFEFDSPASVLSKLNIMLNYGNSSVL